MEQQKSYTFLCSIALSMQQYTLLCNRGPKQHNFPSLKLPFTHFCFFPKLWKAFNSFPQLYKAFHSFPQLYKAFHSYTKLSIAIHNFPLAFHSLPCILVHSFPCITCTAFYKVYYSLPCTSTRDYCN